nr:hypothetical protein [uncultured Anaerostipes sp.]
MAEKSASPAEDGRKEWIEACFADEDSGIVSDCENAKEYRRIIGLQI